MRNRFDEQLAMLNTELIAMGALCETAIATAAKALLEGDISLVNQVHAADAEIDQKERDIESLCLKLLLQQQPVARDLRQISAALKMITDMERIGDQAADIADIISAANLTKGAQAVHIGTMARATIKMVTESIDAFVKKDLDLACQVVRSDDQVDQMFCELKAGLPDLIMQDAAQAQEAIDLLMIAKYFERIGDHATNIAQWVQFGLTGQHQSEK
ncbi:MAG: phosphate signaling complex protein PhoU [Pygmaiobacter massiliensis]|nr:phosphate signaling complex protein PhoU [Pygmaiobacter massiliensis]